MGPTRVIKYNDLQSTLALWLKVFTLGPIWAYPLIPMLGFFVALFGWHFSQVCFAGLVIWAFGYFVEDLLKRKLTLTNEILHFGYKQFPLNELEAIGLKYGKNKILPSHLVFRFKQGRQLKLKLNRVPIYDLDFLVRHIESNYKLCKIDPAVTSLSVLRTVAKKNLTATSDRLEIPYASHRPIKEMIATFVSAASGWTRFGPLLCIPFFGTVWGMSAMSALYTSFMNPNIIHDRRMEIQSYFQTLITTFGFELSKGCGSASVELMKVVSNPFYALVSFMGVICILYYFVRVVLQTNNLVVTPEHLDKNLSLGPITLTLDRLDWKDVTHATLIAPENHSSDNSKIVKLERADKKPFALNLNSLDPEDRQLLNQRLKQYAPNATHSENFDEALLTRQKSSYTELWLQSLTAPPKRASVKPLIPGELLRGGQFEVIGRLGLGGQGTAYLCTELGKKVVLKETILPTFVDQAARQHALSRFEKEARLLNEMDHPQIVKLTDYFIEDHRSYLVLEHIDGNNLKEVVSQKGKMSEEEVRAFALQMCDILDYLHSLNVVHRDFTPDNLMLTQNGVLKLIDFNVAKNEEAGITATVVGKHAYIPPEQFRGKPTHRSDLYA
ncbi:MAG: serine/threonine protein kinase, partial [Candidatus Melainabacteria bacterium]|nr:serine/threonine protein kinase [Candidatus Melainabacteria bacterium]